MPRKQNKKKRSRGPKSGVTVKSNPVKVSGKGGFFSDLLKPMLKPIGSALTTAAKPLLQAIGMGDYKVQANTLWNTNSTSVPEFSDNVDIRLRRKEFIADIHGTSELAITKFVINPTNSDLFPWLSNITRSFQQWKMHGGMLVFVPTTADYSATSALGTVTLATQYDVKETEPTTMSELLQLQYSTAGKPSEQLVHPFECKPSQTVMPKLYTSSEDEGTDRFSDFGHTFIATEGTPTGVIGQLWITYDIILNKPSPNYQAYNSNEFYTGGTAEQSSVATVPTPVMVTQYNTLGLLITQDSNILYINFPVLGTFNFNIGCRFILGTYDGSNKWSDATFTNLLVGQALGSGATAGVLNPVYTTGGTQGFQRASDAMVITDCTNVLTVTEARKTTPSSTNYHLRLTLPNSTTGYITGSPSDLSFLCNIVVNKLGTNETFAKLKYKQKLDEIIYMSKFHKALDPMIARPNFLVPTPLPSPACPNDKTSSSCDSRSIMAAVESKSSWF